MQKITVYWRDIPSQVIIRKGRTRGKALLPQRFQAAIDRAAMRAGRGGSEEYIADWRRETETWSPAGVTDGAPSEDLHAVAAAEARRLEAAYHDDDLQKLVKNFGNRAGA